jgi:hypothetical protein
MANTRIAFNASAPFAMTIVNEATFDTDPGTGDVSLRPNSIPDIGALHKHMFPDGATRNGTWTRKHIPGNAGTIAPGSTLDVEIDLAGLKSSALATSDATDFAAAVVRPFAAMFEAVMGPPNSTDVVVATVDDPAGSAASINVGDGEVANLTEGAGFLVQLADDTYEIGFSEDQDASGDPDTLAPRQAMSALAKVGTNLQTGITYYPGNPSGTYTLRMIGQLVDTTTPIYVSLSGCAVSRVVFAATAGEIIKCTATFAITSAVWTDASASGADSITDNWPHPAPEQYADAQNRFVWGSTTLVVPEWSLTLDRGLTVIESPLNAHGIGGYAAAETEDGPAVLETTVWGDETIIPLLRAEWEAQTGTDGLLWTHGSAPGKMFGWNFPAPHMSAYAEAERSGLLVANITWRCQEYTGDTDTGGVTDEPFYMFMG